jgi:hypothetical protein
MTLQLFCVLLIAVCAFRIAWACLAMAEADDDGAMWARLISILVNFAISVAAMHFGGLNG